MSDYQNMNAAEVTAQQYMDAYTQRATWTTEVAYDREYHAGRQWKTSDQERLDARGQAALVINRIYPAIQQKLAMLLQHRPTARAIPIEENDSQAAEFWTMVIQHVLLLSDFELADLQVKEDHLIAGQGWYYVYFDDEADEGRGDVRIAAVPPELVYVDMQSRKPDYSDAAWMMVTRVYTMEQAKLMFPDDEEKLKAAEGEFTNYSEYATTDLYSGENTIAVPEAEQFVGQFDQERVRIFERYSKTRVPIWIITRPGGDFYDVADAETYEQSYKGNPEFLAEEATRLRVEKIVSCGSRGVLSEEVLPIVDYPLIPVPNVWIGTPCPLSDTRYMRGPQDELNHRRSSMIHHQTSLSSPKWLLEEGSVDAEEWDAKSHIAGARLYYQAGFQPPKEVFSQPMPNGLVHLESEAKSDLDHIAGVYGVSYGDPTSAPDTVGATLALEEYANRRAQPQIERFNHAKKVMSRVIIGLAYENYSMPKMLRIVGDDGLVQHLQVTPKQLGIESNIALSAVRYDIAIQSGRVAPTNRIANAQFGLELKREGVVDAEYVLDMLDIPKKAEVKERISQVNQLMGQVQQLSQQVKDLQGQNQRITREIQSAQTKLVVGEARVREKSAFQDTKLELEREENRAEIDRLRAKEEMKWAIKQAVLEIKEEELAREESELKKQESEGSNKE